MQPLIAELAELIIKDHAILFVGAQLGAGNEKPPVVEQIADALAERIEHGVWGGCSERERRRILKRRREAVEAEAATPA